MSEYPRVSKKMGIDHLVYTLMFGAK
jgi:hypothetical protein